MRTDYGTVKFTVKVNSWIQKSRFLTFVKRAETQDEQLPSSMK